ncbi:MAG TPA: hypothetical protein VGN17_16270 [Bryobacteraceae bacterium]|jgi:hypothetical protein
MNGLMVRWMAVAGVLLGPVVGSAQVSCTTEGLNAAADLYVAAQGQGLVRPVRATPAQGAPYRLELAGLPVAMRMSYVENFETVLQTPRVIEKALKIDRHLSLLDRKKCETFTEALVADQAGPYALGARMRVTNEMVSEMETVWSAPGYAGFDIDAYLKNSSAEDWGPIALGERDSRATLEAVANAYLDALVAGKAAVMPWGLPCARAAADGSCQVGVPAGAVNIANRHSVVDETLGAVAVLDTFGADPGSGRIRAADVHVFRVQYGKVRYVHAVTHWADGGRALAAATPTPGRR